MTLSRRAARRESPGEELMAFHLKAAKITGWEREYRFDPKRRWRFDFAFPAEQIAVEIEGAVWAQGRHTRGSGFVKDLDKYNAAALDGWLVLRVTPQQVGNGLALKMIEQALS